MRSLIAVILAALFFLGGCQREPASPPGSGPQPEKSAVQITKVLRVKVSTGGDITADGQPVTVQQLALKLAELKAAGGGVWYHRENPTGEPHPYAEKVIALIIEHKLPVRLSARPDFSDVVDDKGVSRPGQ